MADFLSIEVTGNRELLEYLRRAVQQLEDPRELLQAIGGVLEGNIQRRFDRKVDPSGTPWAPRAASTLKKYEQDERAGRRDKQSGRPLARGTLLERTRLMRQSLASNVVGDEAVDVGMNRRTDKGKWQVPLLHETGTARMPRRGIFFADPDAGTLGAEDEADLQAEIRAFLDEVFGA